MRQTIRVWVEDKPGALMRVAGIISAKGANIHALTLAPDPWQEGVSTITIVSELEPRLHQRVVNEMNRLVNVFLALDMTGTPLLAAPPEPVREPFSAQPPGQATPAHPMATFDMSLEQLW